MLTVIIGLCLRKLPANGAYAFVLGEQLVGMNVGAVDQYLFATRQDAIDAASARGLSVDAQGFVTIK